MVTEVAALGRQEGLGARGSLAEPISEPRTLETVKNGSDTEFADEANELTLAAAFKAISHPVRMRIIELLSRQSDPMCVCHIESCFTLSQPTISHHLRLLRRSGLVNSERRGTWIYYSVRKEGVRPLHSFMTSILRGKGESAHASPNCGTAETERTAVTGLLRNNR